MKWLWPLSQDIDLPSRFKDRLPPIATRLIVAGNCLGTMAIIRALLDMITPGAAPFALVYPAVMMATLFAGLLAGAITLVVSVLWAWYFIMHPYHSFAFDDPSGPKWIAVVMIAGVITLLVAYVCREAVRTAQAERMQQIADRDLFLREVEHRVKNNFAIVISLLDLQRRRADPATADALSTAKARIEGIARAHQHLYRGASGASDTIEMSAYLKELCSALGEALSLEGGFELHCASDRVAVDRDRAVSIGLIVNELVTNAAKHAFAGRNHGRIDVACRRDLSGLRVSVVDNGIGFQPATPPTRQGGLGSKLIEAFARQAGGTVTVNSDATGTRVVVDLAD